MKLCVFLRRLGLRAMGPASGDSGRSSSPEKKQRLCIGQRQRAQHKKQQQQCGGGEGGLAPVLVCWRRPLASGHCVRVLSPEDPPKPLCWPHRFCFSVGGGAWHQHI